jgi:hypothetical protein
MKDQSAKEKLVPVGKHKGEPLEVLLSDLEAQQWWLGDDYPDVLRKMTAKKISCLFYAGYDGSATPEQLEDFFASRGIVVISKRAIQEVRLPMLRHVLRQPSSFFHFVDPYDAKAGDVTGYRVWS